MRKNVVDLFLFNRIANHPNIMGFDPNVNQRLLPPTFPRYTKIKPRIDTLEYLIELINRFKMVIKITNHAGFHAALVGDEECLRSVSVRNSFSLSSYTQVNVISF